MSEKEEPPMIYCFCGCGWSSNIPYVDLLLQQHKRLVHGIEPDWSETEP